VGTRLLTPPESPFQLQNSFAWDEVDIKVSPPDAKLSVQVTATAPEARLPVIPAAGLTA